MFGVRLEAHQIHDIDDPDLQVGEEAAEHRRGRESLEGRDISGASHHDVGEFFAIATRPLEYHESAGAVRYRLIHGQVVERRLFSGHDQVDVIPAPQAVVGH
jgi:hypothetical protein